VGVWFGVAYSAWALVLLLLRGSEPFDRLGTTVGKAILFYLAAGVISGTIIGLLLPIGRWLAGALLIGVMAGIPVGALIAVINHSRVDWWQEIPTGVEWGALEGALLGVVVWSTNRHLLKKYRTYKGL